MGSPSGPPVNPFPKPQPKPCEPKPPGPVPTIADVMAYQKREGRKPW